MEYYSQFCSEKLHAEATITRLIKDYETRYSVAVTNIDRLPTGRWCIRVPHEHILVFMDKEIDAEA